MRRHVTVFLHGMWTFFFFRGATRFFRQERVLAGHLPAWARAVS